VVVRRQSALLAARTPLRTLIVGADACVAVTGADCLTATRRSRGKDAAQDKSKNILLAPSMKARFLRGPSRNGTCGPRAHCDLSTPAKRRLRALPSGNYLEAGLSEPLRDGSKPGDSRPDRGLILSYGTLYAFGRKTKEFRPANHSSRQTVFCKGNRGFSRDRALQVNLLRRISWLLNVSKNSIMPNR